MNTHKGTCTCKGFQAHGHCRHLSKLKPDPELPGIAPEPSPPAPAPKKQKADKYTQAATMKDFDSYVLTRLSENFILRDFLYSTQADLLEKANRPSDDPQLVIESGKVLCAKVLEPLIAKFGKLWITFGYQSREVLEATSTQKSATSSSPHQWDRGTHGKEIYCRVDILPKIVEDGLMSKYDYAKWAMNNLDLDLFMMWEQSNVMCITYSQNRQRRVCLEWVTKGKGDSGGNSKTIMGEHYWTMVWPKLPTDQRPKFGPSKSGGKMWFGS